MVLAAMREAGTTPQNTVVVGDTVFDIAMARAAGASAIGVSWGYHARDSLMAAGAPVIDAFATLEPALDRIWTL
jgi:phosphoglycolate phosphatase